MKNTSYTNAIILLNDCILKFNDADSKDLATLGIILARLDELLDDPYLPELFHSKLKAFTDKLSLDMLEDFVEESIRRGPDQLSQIVDDLLGTIDSIEETVLTDEQKQFVQENISMEYEKIEELEELLMELENDPTLANCWQRLKGLIHTIKGDFGVLGLSSMVQLIHQVETTIIEKTVDQSPEHLSTLFTFKDYLNSKISELAEGVFHSITQVEINILLGASESSKQGLARELVVDADESLLIEFVTEGKEHLLAAEAALIELETDSTNSELINAAFRSCHTIKGVAGFINLVPMQELAHALENIMDEIREDETLLTPELLSILLEGFDHLGKLVDAVETLIPEGTFEVEEATQDVYKRLCDVDLKSSSSVVVPVEEPVASKPVAAPTKEVVQKPVENVPAEALIKKVPAEKSVDPREKKQIDETVRVSVKKLDLLIDSIGEVVIAQSMLTADPDFVSLKTRQLEQKATQISMVMRQIQEEAMSLRMVSLKSTFQKMNRLVRDLSSKMNKPINLVISGENTELDKSIIEHIGDPLVHMLRNSIDHGVEATSEERLAADKDVKGTIELKAYHKSGNVVIDIIDDGKGLDKDVLLRKAIENGIANPDKEYSEEEIFQFIFAAGFSTATEITDVSGRGVGMDVVKRNILNLRGSLDIQSTKGKGTCFSIKLPLTMAIIDGMIVSACSEQFILPTLSVVSTVSPHKEQVQTVSGKGEMLKLHDDLYRFVRLQDLLKLEGEHGEISDGIAILIEDIRGQRVALWVNSIIKKQQVVIKSMGPLFQSYKWLSGSAVLGSGKVNLILDVNALFQLMEE